MKRIWTSLILVLVIIILIEVSSITSILVSSKQKAVPSINDIPPTPTVGPISLSTQDPIPLSRDTKWNLVSLDDPSSIYNQTHDDSLLYLDDKNKPLNIRGREWWGILPDRTFFEEYSKALNSSGWKNNTIYNNREIQMLPADGPLGSTYGYIKIEKNYARIIILSMVSVSPQTLKTSGDCPCKYKYNIFISDILEVDSLKIKD